MWDGKKPQGQSVRGNVDRFDTRKGVLSNWQKSQLEYSAAFLIFIEGTIYLNG